MTETNTTTEHARFMAAGWRRLAANLLKSRSNSLASYEPVRCNLKTFCACCGWEHDDEDLTDEDVCHRCDGGVDERAAERRQMGLVNF